MTKLDATDVSIIQELNADGRTTATEIADKWGNISERVVQYRIKKLIRDEVIRVVAIIELEPLGFLTRADVLIDVEAGKIKSVSRQLAKYDAISYIACHFGAHDISITVHARDNKDFLTFLNESITSVSGVLNVQPILLPQLLKYPYLWFGFDVGRSIPPMPFTSYTSSQSIKLEAVDIEIINLLIDDGRISCAQIARRLNNCSTEFVRNRIEFLIQKKIIQIKAVVNPEKLGYQIRADMFVKSEAGQTMEVAQKLAQLPITSRVACGMGGDISVQLHGRSNDEIYDFITNTIPGIRGVKKTHTNIVAKLVKEFHLCHLPKSIVL
jgi:Lrp/AsnC family transcriptional regulator for asnA, asnC and gidA